MHVIKIQVSDSEILEGIIDGSLDLIDVMAVMFFSAFLARPLLTGFRAACVLVIPQLAGNPQILPAQASEGEAFGNTTPNLLFVPISSGAINVTIALLAATEISTSLDEDKVCVHGPRDQFATVGLEVPSAEPDQWNSIDCERLWFGSVTRK
jgi:hypothetical protein